MFNSVASIASTSIVLLLLSSSNIDAAFDTKQIYQNPLSHALKKTFQQSNAQKAFKTLSKYFIMVNTEDDEEPYEAEYQPDGKYIPRVLFLDKNGDLLPEFKNKNAEYKNYSYYYSSPADVLNTMKDIMRYYNIDVPEMKKGSKLKPNKPIDEDDKKTEEKKAEVKKESEQSEKEKKKSEL